MADDRFLKPIKEYKLKSSTQAHYIPVMDKNAVLAARAIVKKDIEKYYKLLKTTFEEIGKDEIYHEPLAETILLSRENFTWYATLLKELENILDVREKYKYEVPFEKCPVTKHIQAPAVYQPFRINKCKGEYALCNYRILSKKLQPINNYRILYIMENYDMSEFVDDAFPAWYLLKDTTIFEQYSEKTNARVRIDFRGGEFIYYVAGASDNWKKLEGLPQEMDHVIAALLFRSYEDVQ
jgi:hypothetical protein